MVLSSSRYDEVEKKRCHEHILSIRKLVQKKMNSITAVVLMVGSIRIRSALKNQQN
jgi:hypothetical protein